jgi:hypothetical protein
VGQVSILKLACKHKVLTWSAAWAIAWSGFFYTKLFGSSQQRPNSVLVTLGLVTYALAGSVTFPHQRQTRSVAVWGLAYVAALSLGTVLGEAFERSGSSAGFVGTLAGWAVGAAFGALGSGYLSRPRHHWEPLVLSFLWGVSFFVAGYVSLASGMVLMQAAKNLLSHWIGYNAALTIGSSLAGALGGALASSIVIALWGHVASTQDSAQS